MYISIIYKSSLNTRFLPVLTISYFSLVLCLCSDLRKSTTTDKALKFVSLCLLQTAAFVFLNFNIMKVPKTKEDITINWLNSILSSKNITVKSFKWEGHANNGLGFMSSLERISLQIIKGKGNNIANTTEETLSVILKTLPLDPELKNYVVSEGFSTRELKMYTELFGDWEEFLDRQNVPPEHRFRYPICYYGAAEGCQENGDTRQILILEDLFTSNFEMWPEGFGKSFTWADAKPIVRLIALFHATGLGYKISHNFNSYSEKYPFLILVKNPVMLDYYFNSGFDVINKVLVDYAEDNNNLPLPSGLLEHLEVLRTKGFNLLKHLEPKENELGTVCHNDLHVNNFMFPKTVGNEEEEAVFFDFQASFYSKPMKDLSFFLIQNCETSLLSTEFGTVIQYYHKIFHGALKAMNVNLEYSVDQIMEEYRNNAFLSVLHIIAGAANWCSETSGVTHDTKMRFRNALIHMYQDGMLKLPNDD